MINASTRFKQNLGKIPLSTYLVITLSDSTVLNITDSDICVGGFKISDGVTESGEFTVGGCIVNKLTVTLDDSDETYVKYDFFEAKVIAYVGMTLPDGTIEKLKKGVFTVDETSYDGELITLECLDNMSKLDEPYSDIKTTYPATIGNIIRDICQGCSVVLNTATYDGSSITIQKRPDSDSTTCRQVLSYAVQRICKFARCNVDGALEIGWFDQSTFEDMQSLNGGVFDSDTPYSSGDTASGGTFSPWSDGDEEDGGTFVDQNVFHHFYFISSLDVAVDDITITGIEVTAEGDSAADDSTVLYGTDDYVLSLSGNEFITNEEEATAAAKYIGDKLIGLKFRPLEGSFQPDPTVEAGDIAYVSDGPNKTYNIFVTNCTYNPDEDMDVSCDAEIPRRSRNNKPNSMAQTIAKMRKETKKQISNYDLMVQQMNQLAANTFGFYFTAVQLEDGSYLYYKHDKPKLSESKVVYKSGIDGFFVTQNYTGDDSTTVWKAGFDSSGNAVLNQLAVTGLYWDWGVGGQLTLGGAGNGNGVLHVLNASGEKKVELSNCGQVFFNAEGKATATVSEDEFLWFLEPITLTAQETEFSAIMHNSKGVYKATGSIWKSNDDIATITWETDPDYVKVEGAAETEYDYPEPLYKNDKDHWFGKLYKLEAERSYFSYAPQIYNITQHTDGQNVTWNNDNQTLRRRSSSSKRYKDVGAVISLTDLEEWYKITPVWARYKEGYLSEEDSRYGKEFPMFIAEDVAEHFPLAADYLPDGRPETWNSFVMIPAMFAMLKEQHEQIERLKKLIEGGE